MSLVLVLKRGESLQVGDAVLRMEVRHDGRIRVFIDADKNIPVLRESAIKKVAS